MRDKEFTWRGLKFVWNGRQRSWICERPEHHSGDWWITLFHYERSHMLKAGQEINWDSPPGDSDSLNAHMFATAGWLAHFGHGDAAVRPTREAALEAALQYAIRFHHQSLAELRKVALSGELCRAISGGGPTLTPVFCEHLKGHNGDHSWEIRKPAAVVESAPMHIVTTSTLALCGAAPPMQAVAGYNGATCETCKGIWATEHAESAAAENLT